MSIFTSTLPVLAAGSMVMEPLLLVEAAAAGADAEVEALGLEGHEGVRGFDGVGGRLRLGERPWRQPGRPRAGTGFSSSGVFLLGSGFANLQRRHATELELELHHHLSGHDAGVGPFAGANLPVVALDRELAAGQAG